MSKADDAIAAVEEVKDAYLKRPRPVSKLIDEIASDYGIKPTVVHSWILREFPTEESLNEWRRDQIKIRRQKNSEKEVSG